MSHTSTPSGVRLHPDDRAKTEAAISRAIESCGDYEADYRVVHPDGSVRWVAARGRVLADQDGRPARMLGAAYDTSDVHSAAERLGRVLSTMSTAFFTIDRDWRFTYVNAAAERILGRADLVGQVIWEVYDDLDGTESDINYRGAMATGEPRSFEQFYPPLNAHFDVRVEPGEDGISVYFHDITSRVRAEREREAALRQTGEATGRLQILSAAARGWRGRSTWTSCCASSATSSSTASARASCSRSTRTTSSGSSRPSTRTPTRPSSCAR